MNCDVILVSRTSDQSVKLVKSTLQWMASSYGKLIHRGYNAVRLVPLSMSPLVHFLFFTLFLMLILTFSFSVFFCPNDQCDQACGHSSEPIEDECHAKTGKVKHLVLVLHGIGMALCSYSLYGMCICRLTIWRIRPGV